MRQAARGARGTTTSIPAPVGGLNAVDPLADMPPTDAIQMDNWVPGVNSCSVRPGYAAQVTGFGSEPETLLVYNSATTSKMFAAQGTAIYDVSAVGALGAAVVSGVSNARWQYANFGTVGGQFMLAVNGADKMRIYDGSKWMITTDGSGLTIASITNVTTTATLTTTAAHNLVSGQLVTVAGTTPAAYSVANATITVTGATTFTYVMASNPGGVATVLGTLTVTYPQVTGFDTALAKDIQVYGSRVWLVEKSSFRVWYLPVNSIGGAASSIDFSSLFILGGSLSGMVTWQVASEYGVVTYATFISSMGEVLLYQGLDPSNAATWAKVGQFRIGRPIGQRFYERQGNDTVLITTDGLVPMSKAAITNRQSSSDAISYKIIQKINDDQALYSANFGWQVTLFPAGNRLFLNVPRNQTSENIQYVMNTITNKWCRYTDIGAKCWAVYNDKLYFAGKAGSAFGVYQAETGNDDNGNGITAAVTTAYSYFGADGINKLFTAVRPIITANGTFTPSIGVALDFQGGTVSSAPQISTASSTAAWNTSPWNTTPWGSVYITNRNWQWAGGVGFAGAMLMQSQTKTMSVTWASTDWLYERGGVL